MKRITRVLLLITVLAFVQNARAQFFIPGGEGSVSVTMSGPTSAKVGDYDYYYINVEGGWASAVSYSVTNATIITQTNSYVFVRWTATGTGNVRATVYANNNLYQVSRTVNVTTSGPATPPTPTVSTNTCGNKTVTRANPPSGVTYYWQTSSSGTSTSNSVKNYTVTYSRTLYLRARNNSGGAWSSARSVSVTVNPLPALPDPISVQNRCGDTKLEKDDQPSGVTWYWQTSASGTSMSNSNTNYYVTSDRTVYLRGRNNSSGCWGPSRSVSVTVNQPPSAPTITSSQNTTDGGYTLTRGNPPSGQTWYWQGTNASGQSRSNSSATYTTTASGTYYLRARNNSTGCWSSATGQSVTIDLSKVPSNFSSVASENQITLNWNAVSGASSFNLLRSVSATGPYAVVKSVQGSATSTVDTDLDYETTYYYKLQSITNGVYSLPSSASSSTTTIEGGGNVDYSFDPQYNGNIAGITWNTGEKEKRYNYHYDPMNRIKAAQYAEKGATGLFNQRKGGQQVFGINYDLNGNIKALSRQNVQGNTKLIDVLTYHYEQGASNQLQYVEDAASYDGGFNDGNTSNDDYGYDDNGNMTRDRNKDIIQIDYNYLNLPERVEKADGQYIKYYYDAAGVKLAQEVYDASNTLIKRTDYIGEFIFEQEGTGSSELALIQHEEGRIVPDELNGGFEYQYHLKDHLGNTRVTFTTKPKTIEFSARFETESASDDEVLFENLDQTRVTFNGADGSVSDVNVAGDNEVVRTSSTQPMGTGISLPVGKGDIIDMEVFGYYEGGSGYSQSLGVSAILSAVASGFGGIIDGTEAQQITYNAFNSAYSGIGVTGSNNDNVPAAFLNYIFFDEDFNYYGKFGFDQIGSAGNFGHDKMELQDVIAEKAGYIYVYVSYESAAGNPVYFDDMKITVEEHPVIQRDDYYPFGLTFNSWQRSATSTENKFLYNGIERISDLDIGWDMAHFRALDPAIGRWIQIDPKVDQYYSWSPYNSMGNNPINIMDPLGDEWVTEKDKKIADNIRDKVSKVNDKLTKANAKIDKKIAKAKDKGKDGKVEKLEAQKESNTLAIGINNTTVERLDYMESTGDNVPKFTFKQVSGDIGGTEINRVSQMIVMEVTSSLGNKVHEVSHGWDMSPKGRRDGEENEEIRAYQAQYSADPSSMPNSEADPSRPSSVNGVTGVYVGGIMKTITDKNGNTKTEPVYKQTYKKYQKQYKKSN